MFVSVDVEILSTGAFAGVAVLQVVAAAATRVTVVVASAFAVLAIRHGGCKLRAGEGKNLIECTGLDASMIWVEIFEML
jgi:hypothetical protein